MLAYLKIKVVSLAAEARLIHQAERKLKRRIKKRHGNAGLDNTPIATAWRGLNSHRKNEVRSEARAAQLAYGYLRGRTYKQLEAKCWLPPKWGQVAKIAAKFGEPKIDADRLKAWSEGKAYVEPEPAKKPGILKRIFA